MPTSARVASRATRSSRPSSVFALCAIPLAALSCGGHARPSLRVSPERTLSTQPLAIRASGLTPHAVITLAVRARDSRGVLWTSATRFRADRHGVLDPARAPAIGGSYTGTWPMGAFTTLAPQHTNAEPYFVWAPGPLAFTVSVSEGGNVRAGTTVHRGLGIGGPVRYSVAKDGLDALYIPPRGRPRRDAVLVFGGSEGGLHTTYLAAALAGAGHPALALGYFNAPGLPRTLTRIPLEYFVRALRRLAREPGVDPKRIDVLGISRGSEAAQLLGVHFPALVHAVVAVVPSNAVNCGYPYTGCHASAWTLHGRQVPWTSEFNTPEPTDVPAARIPDERLRGPVLFVCAEADGTWDSCAYARAAMRRLGHFAYRHELLVAPHAGHNVGQLAPYEPGLAISAGSFDGLADEHGRERVWPRVLAFLDGK